MTTKTTLLQGLEPPGFRISGFVGNTPFMPQQPILLFDIDGTLLETGGAGGIAFARTLQSQFGIQEPKRVPMHGRTDAGILGELFKSTPSKTHLPTANASSRPTFLPYPKCSANAQEGSFLEP
ncbi:MAG: hypothetical protein U0905_05920 [Pirellulales bacterium]